jgi:hypothetical protein
LNAPQLRIEPLGVAKREGEAWRTTWRIANTDAEAVRVLGAIAPHTMFRGETTVDRVVRGKGTTQFPLVVRTEGKPGGEIENAFVIVLLQASDTQWRLLARLRVALEDAARPRPRVETVTVQRVGFSGEL